MNRYLGKVRERYGSEAATAVGFTNDWLAGLVTPPGCILPSHEFARTVADYKLRTLASATPDTLEIYVSHDTYVGSIMFHWFGVPIHQDGVDFLDGFLLQLRDDRWLYGSGVGELIWTILTGGGLTIYIVDKIALASARVSLLLLGVSGLLGLRA